MKKFILLITLVAVALALTASAQTTVNTSTPPKNTVDLACVQKAVEKRDTAIVGVLDSFYSAAKSALSTRMNELKNAFGNTDRKARRDAIKAVWKKYSAAMKQAQSTARSARKAAWDQYKKDIRSCGPGASSEDATSHSADAISF